MYFFSIFSTPKLCIFRFNLCLSIYIQPELIRLSDLVCRHGACVCLRSGLAVFLYTHVGVTTNSTQIANTSPPYITRVSSLTGDYRNIRIHMDNTPVIICP